jgi:hypothetical protein
MGVDAIDQSICPEVLGMTKCSISKAIGSDLLHPRLLKEAASILKYPLCTLFNLSLTLSYIAKKQL